MYVRRKLRWKALRESAKMRELTGVLSDEPSGAWWIARIGAEKVAGACFSAAVMAKGRRRTDAIGMRRSEAVEWVRSEVSASAATGRRIYDDEGSRESLAAATVTEELSRLVAFVNKRLARACQSPPPQSHGDMLPISPQHKRKRFGQQVLNSYIF